MRAYAGVQLVVSDDDDQVRKIIDVLSAFDDTGDTCALTSAGMLSVAASAANQAVEFGSITTASTVLILAYDEIHVRLGANDAPLLPIIPLEALDSADVISSLQKASQPGIAFWRGEIDSIYLTNPSSTAAARVYVALLGDAA